MNNKKWLLAITLIFALALALSACGNNDKDEQGAGGENTPPVTNEQENQQSPAPKKDVEIVVYSTNFDPEDLFNFRFGDSLRKKFPDYKISYIQNGQGKSPAELITSNTRFDIFFQAIAFYENVALPHGFEYDMSDLIKQYDVDLNRYEPTAISAIKQLNDGKIYSLPVYGNTVVMYYNEDIFDKFGVDSPRDGMTWDETIELAKAMTRKDGDTQYIGLMHSPNLTLRMNPMSIPNIDLETMTPTINKDDRWKQFFDLFYSSFATTDFRDAVNALGGVNPAINAFHTTKTVALYPYLASMMTTANPELNNFNWDLVSLPEFSENPGVGAQINTINFGITNMAKDKEEAMEVIKYMGSDEFQSELARKAVMPVLRSVEVQAEMGKESPLGEKNYAAVFRNKPAPVPPKALYDADMVTVYNSQGLEVLLGNKDVNTALRDAEELAIQKIKEKEEMNK